MLKLLNIEKSYGNNVILSNSTLEINNGGIYILQGKNGSGKSTIIKIITGLIYKTSGIIEKDISISYLPDKYNMPKLMNVKKYIEHIIYMSSSNKSDEYLLNLYQIPNKRIGELSKGNQQKLGILQTFLLDADCYILDEPLDGLDDFAKKLLKRNIIEKLEANKIILMSLHNKTYFNDLKPTIFEIKDGILYEKRKKVQA